jgi:hypothetical protein
MKKSQMEMMGLAIIVIIISLGLLFVVRFVILNPKQAVSKEFSESELASNFLNTLIETNAPGCSNIKFSTLFMDCAKAKKIYCSGDDSCTYIMKTMRDDILPTTFDEWGISYYFIASTNIETHETELSSNILPEPLFNGIEEEKAWSNCELSRKGKQQPLPGSPPVYLSLYICSG